jgi:8-oxo-dGTP diphosphatase
VVGFCFSKDKSMVALIRKTHPQWQAGRLNGIGGHIERGESIYQAMKREFNEEAGVIVPSLSWNHKLTIINDLVGYELNIMYLFSDAVYRIKTMSDEEVGLYIVEYILNPYIVSNHLIKNLSWIIPLILDSDIENGFIIKDKGKN